MRAGRRKMRFPGAGQQICLLPALVPLWLRGARVDGAGMGGVTHVTLVCWQKRSRPAIRLDYQRYARHLSLCSIACGSSAASLSAEWFPRAI